MTTDEALLKLANSTAAAMVGVLEQLAPGRASHAEPRVAEDAAAALANPPSPGLAASVAYVDGVSGGNVVLIGTEGARGLAAAMMGSEPEGEGAELSEIELSAVAEAMNQMMASAAAETSRTLGYEVEIGTPDTQPTGDADLADAFGDAAHVTVCDLRVCEQPARFVQLVPHAFVVRMTKALEDQGSEVVGGPVELDAAAREALRASLSSTTMRVSAEIGRTHLPVDALIGMPQGTIVELDREADDPIDIYVNGRRFAEGRLVLAEGDEWAVRIERILAPAAAAGSPQPRSKGDG